MAKKAAKILIATLIVFSTIFSCCSFVYADDNIITTDDGYVFNMETGTIIQYFGNAENMVIPEEINGVTVRELAYGMMHSTPLKVIIPKTVETINEYALINAAVCAVEEIVVNEDNPYFCTVDGVLFDISMKKLIAYPALKKGFKYIIPEQVEVLYPSAFENIYLQKIILSKNVETQGIKKAMTNCLEINCIEVSPEHKSLVSVDGVLYSKDMTELIIYPRQKFEERVRVPEGVKIVAEQAFLLCLITHVVLPDTVVEIKEGAFAYSQIEDINISDDVVLGRNVFYQTGIKKIALPGTTKHIYERDFAYCSRLESITLPEGLVSIGNNAFEKCLSLKSITIPGSVTDIADDAFNKSAVKLIYCEKGSYAHSFAKKHNIEFAYINNNRLHTVIILGCIALLVIILILVVIRRNIKRKKMI